MLFFSNFSLVNREHKPSIETHLRHASAYSGCCCGRLFSYIFNVLMLRMEWKWKKTLVTVLDR